MRLNVFWDLIIPLVLTGFSIITHKSFLLAGALTNSPNQWTRVIFLSFPIRIITISYWQHTILHRTGHCKLSENAVVFNCRQIRSVHGEEIQNYLKASETEMNQDASNQTLHHVELHFCNHRKILFWRPVMKCPVYILLIIISKMNSPSGKKIL